MEESKVNNKYYSPKNLNKRGKEILEIYLGRPNPAFNLVSIKARYRFHQMKNKFNKKDYEAYLRRCKNMYSISSRMSAEMNMSDIYHEEKKNINDIINIYGKIDDKTSSKRIRLNKYKESNFSTNYLKGKSLSELNIFKNGQKASNFMDYYNEFKDENDTLRWNRNENNTVNTVGLNNYQKMNSTHSSNFIMGNNLLNNLLNNKKLIKKNYKITNKGSMNKQKKSIFEQKKMFNKTFGPFVKKNDIFVKSEETTENNKKQMPGLEGLYNYKTKQIPISGTSKGMTITNFGAIIYNNSIYRNKGISNFIYDSQSLPLIYNSKY
jgi:hypothetical protein